MFNFLPAKHADITLINELIKKSKSYWDYPPDYLKAAIELMKVDSAYIDRYPSFEVFNENGILVCFCSLKADLLDNLWVDPRFIGQRIGEFALGQIKVFAKSQGIKTLWVLPDPPAEGFYLKYGFQDSGERIPSRIPQGPIFKKFHLDLK